MVKSDETRRARQREWIKRYRQTEEGARRTAESERRYRSSSKGRTIKRAYDYKNDRNPERMRIKREARATPKGLKQEKARSAVRRALKHGLITRPKTCEHCGVTGKPIEGSHTDYDRRLDVEWLCASCHRYKDQGTN